MGAAVTTREIEHAFAEFITTRPAVAETFTAFRKEHAERCGVPGHHQSFPEAFMAMIGLSAEDKAASLDFQRNQGAVNPSQYIAAEAIKAAA
jgi:hypothetical protein